MESAAVLHSIHCSHTQYAVERLCMVPLCNATWPALSKSSSLSVTSGKNLSYSRLKREGFQVLCVRASAATMTAKTGATSDSQTQGSLGKIGRPSATFPNGFEALILEVCDETEVAELKMKVGDFEMHMKRSIEATKASVPVVSPTTPPPIPTKPMIESAPATPPPPPPPPPPKSSIDKVSPFTNVSAEKSAKLAALEASGSSGYAIVSSPTVGSFRRGRTLKGKKQPPACKEGDVIKEGQVIGFLDQFGTELPVRSDAAGEVLKVLFEDGEAVGYGDPLIAVRPLFHGIK